jgi:hypothetical protein
MSRDYWSLACHAGIERVREVMEGFFAQHGSIQRVDQLPSNYGRCIELAEAEGWTVLNASAAGSLPRFSSRLSAELQTTVVVNDENETSAYEHFAQIEAGEPRVLFTRFDDKITDREGVPEYAEMLAAAAASGHVQLNPKQVDIEAGSSYQGLTFLLLAMQGPLGPLVERWNRIVAAEPEIERYTFAIHGSERLGRSSEATSWDRIVSQPPVNLAVAEMLAERIELDRAIAALEKVQLPPAQKALAVIRKKRADLEKALQTHDTDG